MILSFIQSARAFLHLSTYICQTVFRLHNIQLMHNIFSPLSKAAVVQEPSDLNEPAWENSNTSNDCSATLKKSLNIESLSQEATTLKTANLETLKSDSISGASSNVAYLSNTATNCKQQFPPHSILGKALNTLQFKSNSSSQLLTDKTWPPSHLKSAAMCPKFISPSDIDAETSIFVTFSFELSKDQNSNVSKSFSSDVFAANDHSLFALLRYAIDKIASSVDPALKVQIFPPDSHGTVTDDGVRCTLLNVSLLGKSASCIELKRLLVKDGVFVCADLKIIPLSLDLWFKKQSEIKNFAEKFSQMNDVEIEMSYPEISPDSSKKCLLPFATISGKHSALSKGAFDFEAAVDNASDHFMEIIELPSAAHFTKISGPKNRILLEIMLKFCVKLTYDFQPIAISNSNAPKNCRIAVTGSMPAVQEATSFIKNDLLGGKSCVTSRSFTCSRNKLEFIMMHDYAQLKNILHNYGVFLQFSAEEAKQTSFDSEITISIFSSFPILIEQALREIFELIFSYNICILELENTPSNLNYKMDDFDSFECLPAKLRIISQRTDTQILCQGSQILVYGKESSIKNAFMYLKKLNIVISHLQGCSYVLERSSEIKEFICGKKDGKINKIIKETGIIIEMSNSENSLLTIKLSSHNINQLEEGLLMLNGEFPAEISFFVPEVHHKRIIGHGGKNIQRIMKKYGVYIKFLNLEECLLKHGHPSATFFNHNTKYFSNVIVKTPFKNKEVLEEMKAEVLLEAGESEITIEKKEIILKYDSAEFLNSKFCESLKSIFNSTGCDYFLKDKSTLQIFCVERNLLSAFSEDIALHSPVDYVAFENPSISIFQRVDAENVWYARQQIFTHLPSVSLRAIYAPSHKDFCRKESKPFSMDLASDYKSAHADLSCFENALYDKLSLVSDEPVLKCPPGLIGPKKTPNNQPLWNSNIFAADDFSLGLSANSASKLSKDWLGETAYQPLSLEDLLASLGLSKYAEVFKSHEIDLASLRTLTDVDLKEMGISALGPRKKIIQAIQSISPGHAPNSSAVSFDMDCILKAYSKPNMSGNGVLNYADFIGHSILF